jgi:pyruvate kinase
MMADIINEVESHGHAKLELDASEHLKTFPAAVARSAAVAAHELDVKGIVVLTLTGSTARLLMTYRPNKPIFACTPDEKLARQMALYWGVAPHHIELDLSADTDGDQQYTSENAIQRIEEVLKQNHEVTTGDEVIVVMGSPVRPHAETNLIKFHRVG